MFFLSEKKVGEEELLLDEERRNSCKSTGRRLTYRKSLILNDKQMKNLPNNIIGIKRTNNQIELAEIYSAADLLFNPTYEDNYPTVNLESISCGTPVLTYNTGGSPEFIKFVDNNFGQYVLDKNNF